jgi:cell division septum initiation protein DivIVA
VNPADPERSRASFSRPQRPRAGAPVADESVSQSGPRFGSIVPRGGAPTAAPDPVPAASFGTARHGYDRAQVDRYVADLTARVTAADERRLDVTRRLSAERQRAEQVETELRETRTALQSGPQEAPAPAPENHVGFGHRAERILRLAEAEAHEVRTSAATEAATLLERTHAEAEAHRHEVEKGLIARAAKLDEEAAQRSAELQAREQKLVEDLDAARREAELLRGAARREADELRRDAEAAIRKAQAEAEATAGRRREAAAAELNRLAGAERGVRDEFARLHRLIVGQLPAGA